MLEYKVNSPPWTHKNCPFINAASGRQSNASIHASYTRSEYFILPSMKRKCKKLKEMMAFITFSFKSEIFGEMTALVISSQQE